jgi:hypothetical protein
MAEADLDAVIRSIAKKQHKIVMDAARKRHGRLMGMAAKAKDKAKKARCKHLAKTTLLLAGAAARRLQITAENAADSYARAIKKAAEEQPAKPARSLPKSKQADVDRPFFENATTLTSETKPATPFPPGWHSAPCGAG